MFKLFARKVTVTHHINNGQVYFKYSNGEQVIYNIAHRPKMLRGN